MVNWRCVVQCVILTSSLAPAHAPDLDLSTVGFEVIRVRHTLSIRVPGDTKIIGVDCRQVILGHFQNSSTDGQGVYSSLGSSISYITL